MLSIRAEQTDITQLALDAIVNAANPQLLGGGGVDGAIHRAAGPELLTACRGLPELRPGVRCETGDARITPGFRLRARHVIHTVGPVWHGGASDEERRLASCYRSCLALASQHQLAGIAFPAISCGVYGYPHDRACRVAVRALRAYPWADSSVREVVLTAFDPSMLKHWQAALASER
jgi:O-acetyl-ADP-ribose deacetylase (regulator of RNase III)